MRSKLWQFIATVIVCVSVHSSFSQATVVNLGIATGGGQTVLYWPAAYSNAIIQRASSPGSSTWLTVTGAVAVTSVAFPAAQSLGYYRLYIPTNVPAGMVIIPAGTYTMGNSVGDLDIAAIGDATPISVTVSNYYMDANLVSYGQWQSIYAWATTHGYGFVNSGAGKGTNYPVDSVDWFDAVKWSNARSQESGLKPVYYADAGLTQAYTNGEITPYANWTANGYRLPTEAEWEVAARGGLSAQRFPNGNTVSCMSSGNYSGYPLNLLYDIGPAGENPFFTSGLDPYSSPVGFYPPNGYGLYDMMGNASAWCWDWYGIPYTGGTNPHGTATGSLRVFRGGDWSQSAADARTAYRGYGDSPHTVSSFIGFRCVKNF